MRKVKAVQKLIARRQFLILCGLSAGLAACGKNPLGDNAASLPTKDLAEFYKYVLQNGDPKLGEKLIAEHTLEKYASIEVTLPSGDGNIQQQISQLISEEIKQNKIIQYNGWELTHTEASIHAIAYELQSENGHIEQQAGPVSASPAKPTKNIQQTGDKKVKLIEGIDFWGGDIRNVGVSDDGVDECVDICLNEPKCKAFTFVRKGTHGNDAQSLCWIKWKVPEQQKKDTCCVSGIIN